VEFLAHLARALTFQDIHDEAVRVVDQAIRQQDAPALRTLAITVLLRAGRSGAIMPHAESLLKADPDAPLAHFARGIALAAQDRLKEAREELTWGLKIPEAKREAHYQLALVWGKLKEPRRALEHLLEIVVDDPFDQEACYQATRQLTRIRTPDATETAAHLRRYFQAFKEAQGESSRHHPVEALGHAARAALMRAATWKRLRVYDRVITEIGRAVAVARGDPEPSLYEADFWASVGLLAEADAVLTRLEARLGTTPGDVSARVKKLRAALGAGMEKLQAQTNTPLGTALLKVAQTPWQHARSSLEALLTEAVAARKLAVADQTARMLLARDPRSIRALAFLTERSSAPALLIPRLHYLARLVPLLPEDDRYKRALRLARQDFLGGRPR
jgi:tetratricopeptide (TPR) repeat protein